MTTTRILSNAMDRETEFEVTTALNCAAVSAQGVQELHLCCIWWVAYSFAIFSRVEGSGAMVEALPLAELAFAERQLLKLLGDALLCLTFPPTMLRQLHTSLFIIASSRRSTLMAPISESDSHVTLQPFQSRDVATFCISITFSPFFIFFIILLFRLRFLVYRHASHFSRALSFSFRIPC